MKAGKQQEVFRERQALITLDHPNIVKMYWSFDVSYYTCFGCLAGLSLICAQIILFSLDENSRVKKFILYYATIHILTLYIVQDKKYLYFVLDLAPNGELFSII